MEQAKKSRLIITTFSTGKIHPKYLYTIIYLYQTMPWFNFLFQDSGFNLFALTVVAVWTIVWQGLALWHAARSNQRNWFIALITEFMTLEKYEELKTEAYGRNKWVKYIVPVQDSLAVIKKLLTDDHKLRIINSRSGRGMVKKSEPRPSSNRWRRLSKI